MRARTTIHTKSVLQQSFEGFKGVNLSAPAPLVGERRGSYMRNFLSKNGALVKRNGWREVGRIEGSRINGIFQFDDGEVSETLVHAGTELYRWDGAETFVNVTRTSTIGKAEVMGLLDRKSCAFQNNGRLFIVGAGPYMAYGNWGDGYELRLVRECGEVYIPTTSININDSTVENDVRATLDDVNMLTPKRINKLVGNGDFTQTEKDFYWKLDAPVDLGSDVTVYIEYLYISPDATENESEVNRELKTRVLHNNGEMIGNVQYLVDDEDEEEILHGAVRYDTGEIMLWGAYTPYMPGRDNITVTFEHTTEAYKKDYLSKVFTGARFGIDGSGDRLFLAVEGSNLEIYSEMNDFTYFGDRNTVFVGSEKSNITAFAKIDDDTLAIFKEADSEDVPVYYQSGYYDTIYDDEGNLSKMTAYFPVKQGSHGEVCAGRGTIANLQGDLLLASKNGVYGVELTDNVATAQRYTRERSGHIASALRAHDLSLAAAGVFDGRYYLAVGDDAGTCYVADGRLMCYPENTVEKNIQYEWFILDHIPACLFAVLDGRLYFGTVKGQICVFDEEYTDRSAEGEQDIEAEWHSGVLDLGSDEKGKTLLKMTVSAQGTSDLFFGFQTLNRKSMIRVKGQGGFSFDDLSFGELSFSGNFTNSYSVKVKEKDFSYIKFRFRSGAGACAIYKFKAFFRNNTRNKGVR